MSGKGQGAPPSSGARDSLLLPASANPRTSLAHTPRYPTPAVIPAYYNLGDTRRAAALGSLSRASLSALAPGSRLLWLPFAFTYLFIG